MAQQNPRQKTLAKRLRQRRFKLELPQKVVAERAGMPALLLGKWERGDYKTIRPELLPALATALSTTTDYLLGHRVEAADT